MKKFALTLFVATFVIGLSSLSMAADNDAITVNYEVSAINELAIDQASVDLVVNAATAGSEPDADTDSTITYDITTNGSSKKITAAIDTAMPSNVSLKLDVTAPTGGTGAGQLTLSGTAQDAVTGVATVAEADISMSFELSATVAAGVVASANKTCTMTLTDA